MSEKPPEYAVDDSKLNKQEIELLVQMIQKVPLSGNMESLSQTLEILSGAMLKLSTQLKTLE